MMSQKLSLDQYRIQCHCHSGCMNLKTKTHCIYQRHAGMQSCVGRASGGPTKRLRSLKLSYLCQVYVSKQLTLPQWCPMSSVVTEWQVASNSKSVCGLPWRPNLVWILSSGSNSRA